MEYLALYRAASAILGADIKPQPLYEQKENPFKFLTSQYFRSI